jgi:hypothetical protein
LLLDGLAGPLAPDQSDHLKTVLKSVNQLHAMIRDLLEATRAESGTMRVDPRCISIADLIRQATVMMQPLAQESRIGLESGCDHRIPLVHADPDRVLEVLINLIDNAIKFTPPEGSVIVKACMLESDAGAVYVSVSDTGRGIGPEAVSRIFDRLYQDPDSVDGNRSGLGLGLFLAKELVTLHGGRIWVTSQPGQGSTFSFTLPLYSLAKLLSPVITHDGRMREEIVLVRVTLNPIHKALRRTWRELCQQSRDLLPRCVYVDKDLVLPAVGSSGDGETLFVVASTGMDRVDIMMTRIREQIGALPQWKSNGTLSVTATPVWVRAVTAQDKMETMSLNEQVQVVADRANGMIMQDLAEPRTGAAKGKNGNIA